MPKSTSLVSSPQQLAQGVQVFEKSAAQKGGVLAEMSQMQSDNCVIKQSSARLVLEVFSHSFAICYHLIG